MGRDLLCVFDDEKKVRGMTPDMDKVRRLPGLLVHVTAKCQDEGPDCISRSELYV